MSFTRINITRANVMLESSDTVVVDIRDSISFASGHLDGAINLTQNNLNHFVENTDKETNVLVVCYHGNSSQIVAEYLSEYGFRKVYSLDGGYEEWAAADSYR